MIREENDRINRIVAVLSRGVGETFFEIYSGHLLRIFTCSSCQNLVEINLPRSPFKYHKILGEVWCLAVGPPGLAVEPPEPPEKSSSQGWLAVGPPGRAVRPHEHQLNPPSGVAGGRTARPCGQTA